MGRFDGLTLAELRERYTLAKHAWAALERETAGRLPTAEERTALERIEGEMHDLEVAGFAYGTPEHGFLSTRTNDVDPETTAVPTLISREQRDGVTRWARSRFPHEFPTHQPQLRLGAILRGLLSNDWTDADAEKRALGEGTAGAGGVMVPTPLVSDIIDRARAATRVLQAGAKIIPMDSATLKVPRLLTEPTGSTAWRNEAAPIGEQNMTFDALTFSARSMAFYVKASRELVEDTGPGLDAELRRAFAAEVALELDRAALLGTGVAPMPRGVLNTSGVTSTSHGAAGSTIGSPPSAGVMGWEFLVQAVGAVRAAGFEPTAQILAPRTETSLALLRDTSNQYIAPPRALDDIPRLTTTQVPVNVTVGGSTDTSYVFTGDWSMLWIGMRTQLEVSVLRERFMTDSGEYAFVCWMRADVQVAQPAAFVVDLGVRG